MMPLQLPSLGFYLRRLLIVPLLALFVCTGCVRYVPIEPYFAGGRPQKLDAVKTEGGDEFRDAQIAWPTLTVVKEGKPMNIDLRLTAVKREVPDNAATATVVVVSVLGGLVVIGGVFLGVVLSATSHLHD